MMSFVNMSFGEVVKKQYIYKIKANKGFISSLIFTQVIAILFSINGVGSSGFGMDNLSVDVSYFSADMVIVFTLIWAFITGISITTKENRYAEYTFLANRLSSSLSNMLFLVSISVFAGITALLTSYLLADLIFLWKGAVSDAVMNSMFGTPLEYVMGTIATVLYVTMFSASGYIVGILSQVHKAFVIGIPIFIIGVIVIAANQAQVYLLVEMYDFYAGEASFLLFLLKTLFTVVVFFCSATLIGNRLEVRK